MSGNGNPQPNTTEAAVLGLVAFRESSGYDLARLADRSIGYVWTPSRSQIYKVLPRLVANGFARVRAVRQDDRPDKALYRITPAGRGALRRWLETVDGVTTEDPRVFALKLFFCDLVPTATAEAQLAGYRRLLDARLARFETMLRDLDDVEMIFPQLILRRAIVRIRATLTWLAEAEEAVSHREGRSRQGGRW
jgi:DNA-binding PadR family transcriptional regulator